MVWVDLGTPSWLGHPATYLAQPHAALCVLGEDIPERGSSRESELERRQLRGSPARR
jgi:hypothetical protein